MSENNFATFSSHLAGQVNLKFPYSFIGNDTISLAKKTAKEIQSLPLSLPQGPVTLLQKKIDLE